MQRYLFRAVPMLEEDSDFFEDEEFKLLTQYDGKYIYGYLNGEFMLGETAAVEDDYYYPEWHIQIKTGTIEPVFNTNRIEPVFNTNRMDGLIKNVEKWSFRKGLHQAESSKQYLKVAEECGEIAAALARSNKELLKDAIGDTLVTLIILAQQNTLTLEECLETAYVEIAERKGKMINGIFVKESDL